MTNTAIDSRPVLALSGGVGGAKLALGLLNVLPPGCLTVVANTGDDFEHIGLQVSPDIDTLLYVLSGRDDAERGWGRRDESWAFMESLDELGGETWFRLGDRDLAVHVERTRRLRAGEPLSSIVSSFGRRFGIPASIVPMSDDPVRTRLLTDSGWMEFQQWFVGRGAEPKVRSIKFEGGHRARMHDRVVQLLANDQLRAVIVCPSNPFVSIEPILAIPGMRDSLERCRAPVVAVSPLIGGRAVKGPTAKMMREFGIATTTEGIANYYRPLLDGLVIDPADSYPEEMAGQLAIGAVPTLMTTLADRIRVAQATLALAERIDRRAA